MEPHLPGEVRKYLVSAFEGYAKKSIGEGLGHCTENLIRVFRAYHLSRAGIRIGLAYTTRNQGFWSRALTISTFTREASLGMDRRQNG